MGSQVSTRLPTPLTRFAGREVERFAIDRDAQDALLMQVRPG